ncbi:MAG: 16S rRNA (guanine(966)-N(2))-methyltransferase RsmD [Lachnospiraceae bacterium]
MRVIAGSARRLQLKAPAGFETRPTSDKTKETLFNVLMPYVYDSVFLDLFSGSGGIGIEALSRGAQRAIFVERSKSAIKCIEENLKKTKLADNAQVFGMDVMSALRQMEGRYQFDLVFMDPPFDRELEKEVLFYLHTSGLIHENTMIIVEASNETEFDYVPKLLGMEIVKCKRYKSNSHLFIRKRQGEGGTNEVSDLSGQL